jgi:hypothetical protein
MKHLSAIAIVLTACGSPMNGTDAGELDAGSIDAGPSPVTIELVTTEVHANCPTPNTFFFAVVVRYSTDDPTTTYTYNVESALAQLDQAPMTMLDMTLAPASGPINFVGPDGGTPSLVRHSIVDYTPLLTTPNDPCSLCGATKTVTWNVQVSAAGRTQLLSGTSPFTCLIM